MSILSVYHHRTPEQPNKVLTHAIDIAATLAEHGLDFSQHELTARPRPGGGREAVVQALGHELQALLGTQRCTAFEVLDCDGEEGRPQAGEEEHAYPVDEVFVVVSGRAQLVVRRGEWVFAVLCERGDALRVPGGSGRWLSLGDRPFCVAVRLLNGEGNSVPVHGDGAKPSEFPGMDEL